LRAAHCQEAAGYAVPAVVLVLLPKCPACIVAYLAVGAGIGVTVTTAAYLRTALIALCVACLACFVAWRIFRTSGSRRMPKGAAEGEARTLLG